MLCVQYLHPTTYGLPLCVSGITHRRTISKEMADHDLRREKMKRQRSQSLREGQSLLHADREMVRQEGLERVLREIRQEVDGDLADDILQDLSFSYLNLVAKAA